jgi:uncharacterized protein YndB with AHSA1/START domain
MRALGFAAFACALLAGAAEAEVTAGAPDHLAVKETAHIAAAPDKVYAALIHPGRWWNSVHSFSGDAANMSLDARAGGCWCEKLPHGGSAEHLRVVLAVPEKTLRLRGALGPFQGMASDGVMTVTLAPKDGGTDLTLTYDLFGSIDGGFANMAPVVDGNLGEQVVRLKRFVETGMPDDGLKTK